MKLTYILSFFNVGNLALICLLFVCLFITQTDAEREHVSPFISSVISPMQVIPSVTVNITILNGMFARPNRLRGHPRPIPATSTGVQSPDGIVGQVSTYICACGARR